MPHAGAFPAAHKRLQLQCAGSVVAGVQTYLSCSMWNLSSPTGDRVHTPAREGRFLTTGSPGKSPLFVLKALRGIKRELKGNNFLMMGSDAIFRSVCGPPEIDIQNF